MFKALVSNDQAMTVVITIVLINCSLYITSNLLIYFFKYDFGGEGWYNSYYDNHGRAVEGVFPTGVRMMLTGQVFAIMGGVATDEQIRRLTASPAHYL